MANITRSLTGRIVVRMDEDEKIVLGSIVGQFLELIGADARPKSDDPLADLIGNIGVEVQAPEDPALARLFPDAYLDDDEAASDFRRFTQESLRDVKISQATTMVATLERSGNKITLSDAEALAWLAALNDVRLTLGVRLGVTEDTDFSEESEDQMLAIYSWLTYLQESLIQVVAPHAV